MNTINYRPAILAYLDRQPFTPAVAALRALVVAHGAGTRLGQENTCEGCRTHVTFTWLESCKVVLTIARRLGFADCGHEWHGADDGACPGCGWDANPLTPSPPLAALPPVGAFDNPSEKGDDHA